MLWGVGWFVGVSARGATGGLHGGALCGVFWDLAVGIVVWCDCEVARRWDWAGFRRWLTGICLWCDWLVA